MDNIARLIYIINDPKAHNEMKNGTSQLMRHWIDWGYLKRKKLNRYKGFKIYKNSKHINEILNIRNIMTHSWAFPIKNELNILKWPLAMRYKRDLFWPYEEKMKMIRNYRKWQPIIPAMDNDFGYIHKFQNIIFNKLINNIKNFEKNHNIIIN